MAAGKKTRARSSQEIGPAKICSVLPSCKPGSIFDKYQISINKNPLQPARVESVQVAGYGSRTFFAIFACICSKVIKSHPLSYALHGFGILNTKTAQRCKDLEGRAWVLAGGLVRSPPALRFASGVGCELASQRGATSTPPTKTIRSAFPECHTDLECGTERSDSLALRKTGKIEARALECGVPRLRLYGWFACRGRLMEA